MKLVQRNNFLCLESTSDEESKILDKYFGDGVEPDGLIFSGFFEIRLSDDCITHYIKLMKHRTGLSILYPPGQTIYNSRAMDNGEIAEIILDRYNRGEELGITPEPGWKFLKYNEDGTTETIFDGGDLKQ